MIVAAEAGSIHISSASAPPAVRVAYPPVGDVTGLYPVLQDDGKIPVPPADGGALVTPRP